MDPKRFDTFVRSLELTSNRRQALVGLLGGALAAVSGLDAEARRRGRRGRRGSGSGQLRAQSAENGSQGRTRVTVCHKPGTRAEKTKQIPLAALAAHLGHGDHEGECCVAPEAFCEETGRCEACCPTCGSCQTCEDGECRPAEECALCQEGRVPGTCQGGVCVTDGSGCETCEAPLVLCAETGECEACCPLCPECQTCVDGSCQPANPCGPCGEGRIPGVCINGNCLTDGSACAPPDPEP